MEKLLRHFWIEKIYRLHSKSVRNHIFEAESKIWAQIKKWLFVLNLLIFFEKRFGNFDKWGKWRLDPFFPKIVKIMEIILKSHFFQKKNNWKFAAVKKKQVHMLSNILDVSKIICIFSWVFLMPLLFPKNQ